MSGARLRVVSGGEWTIASRRLWLLGVALVGVIVVPVAALVAAGHDGPVRTDSFRAGAASLLLLGGLVVAIGLGATCFNVDARGGWLGLQASAGATREEVALARLALRGLVVVGVLAAWGVLFQIASPALGLGLDGPLALHTLAMAGNMLLVFLITASVSTLFGPLASSIAAGVAWVLLQALSNLNAAADREQLGSVAQPLSDAAWAVLPRVLVSPMISDLQVRGEAGPAAPQFEINQRVIEVPGSTVWTALWTLLWMALITAAIVQGMRRKAL